MAGDKGPESAAGSGSEWVARLGLTALGVVPPALIGAQSWPEVSRNPAVAVLALAGYELLIAVVAFAGKVFGDVQGRWAARVADALDVWLLRRTSRFERDYRGDLSSRHRVIDLKGLATRGDHTPLLEDVFVDVSLVPRPAHETAQDPLAGAVLPGAPAAGAILERRSVWDFLGHAEGAAVVVLGAPGTGKTTMLRHLALRLAEQGGGGRRDLPVLLFLRDHAAAITANPATTLPEIVRTTLRRLGDSEPQGWLEEQLDAGRCIVLLDGLDEVALEDDRRRVSTWVEEQIEQYERNDFVLTSRPHGYLSAPLNRARVLQVRRFTGGQIAQFVRGWYRAMERWNSSVSGADVEGRGAADDRAREAAEDLLARLRARPVLFDLAANPLLLTMIANVHRYRGALPGSRADLYAEICQVLLWRRHEAKNLLPQDAADAGVTGAKKEAVMREFAYVMMADRVRDIDLEKAAAVLEPILARMAIRTAPEDFLAAITASGLLVERERGLCSFAHFTLQEHLAAQYVRHRGLIEVLCGAVDDDWWRETTLLYATHMDPAPVVEACLRSGSTRAFALAFDCEEVATEFAPETARRLETARREALAEPPDSPRRQLMTAVTVTRHLRETVRLSDDTVVCARPVTREVYSLFQDKFLRPSGRTGLSSAASGMTGRDAMHFIRWLNELLPEDPLWRLPRRSEAEDPAFRLTDTEAQDTVWCLPDDEDAPRNGENGEMDAGSCLWVPEGAPHPWAIDLPGPAIDGWLGRDAQGVLAVGRWGLKRLHDHNARLLARDTAYALERYPDMTRVLTQAGSLGFGTDERDPVPDVDSPVTEEFLSRQPTSGSLPFAFALSLAQDLVRPGHPHGLAHDLELPTGGTGDLGHALERARLAAWTYAVLQILAGEWRPRRSAASQVSYFDHCLRPVVDDLAGLGRTRVVTPEDLGAAADAANDRARHRLTLRDEASDELYVLTSLLQNRSTTLLREVVRLQAVGAVEAAHLRLTALTLAVVAEGTLRDPELAETYRTIAAGVTVLDRRARGIIRASETIVLVRAS